MHRSDRPAHRRMSLANIAGRRTLLLATALLGGLTLACAQSDLTGPGQPEVNALVIGTPEYLKCRPLEPALASKYISPGVWDTLKVGPHKLIFKPGSLAQRTLITASFGWDSTRSVRFQPEGLKFRTGFSPTLQLSVSNCGAVPGTAYIAYTDDYVTTVKEKLTSVLSLNIGTVRAPISHFSRYAVHR
jgi:hypothetical protein